MRAALECGSPAPKDAPSCPPQGSLFLNPSHALEQSLQVGWRAHRSGPRACFLLGKIDELKLAVFLAAKEHPAKIEPVLVRQFGKALHFCPSVGAAVVVRFQNVDFIGLP